MIALDCNGATLEVGTRVKAEWRRDPTNLAFAGPAASTTGVVAHIVEAEGDAGAYADDPPRSIGPFVVISWDGDEGTSERYSGHDDTWRGETFTFDDVERAA